MIAAAPGCQPPGAVLDVIEAADGPALAVDLASAHIVAANAGARALLGRDDAARDAAMPAVPALRALRDAGAARNGASPQTLTFWTARGAESWPCRVELVPTPGGGTIGVIRLAGPALDPKHRAAERAAETANAAASQPGPGTDDLATLARIASRIREAQAMRDTNPEPSRPPRPTQRTVTPEEAHPARDHLPDPGSEAPASAPPGRSPRARLAHELKTPLGAIAAAAEMIRDERLGPIANARYRDYAADIAESAHHALAVINRMLEEGAEVAADGAARPATGQAMTFAEIDVNDVARRCASTMRIVAEEAGLSLETRLEERLAHVIADATALRQIVLNLLTNAIKFTAAGGTVSVATARTGDGRVAVSVGDTGRGMTAGEIGRMAHGSSAGRESGMAPDGRREGGGYGIGLPLVRALAEANGAEVSFDSAPGRGTAVTVTFAPDRVIPV